MRTLNCGERGVDLRSFLFSFCIYTIHLTIYTPQLTIHLKITLPFRFGKAALSISFVALLTHVGRIRNGELSACAAVDDLSVLFQEEGDQVVVYLDFSRPNCGALVTLSITLCEAWTLEEREQRCSAFFYKWFFLEGVWAFGFEEERTG